VLQLPLDEEQLTAVRASNPKRLPTVLSKQEAIGVIDNLQGANQLITKI